MKFLLSISAIMPVSNKLMKAWGHFWYKDLKPKLNYLCLVNPLRFHNVLKPDSFSPLTLPIPLLKVLPPLSKLIIKRDLVFVLIVYETNIRIFPMVYDFFLSLTVNFIGFFSTLFNST